VLDGLDGDAAIAYVRSHPSVGDGTPAGADL